MNRIYRYLDKALHELYKYDSKVIKTQSLNSISFRLGLYLNNFLKNDHLYNHLYVDFKFSDNKNNYLDLLIHNRKTKENLLVIKLVKNPNEIKDDLEDIKLITTLEQDKTNYGALIVLFNDNYNTYRLSNRYYDVDFVLI